MSLHFLIKTLTFHFQMTAQSTSMHMTVQSCNIQRKLAFNFYKVQRPVYHVDGMVGYTLSTAWVNGATYSLRF